MDIQTRKQTYDAMSEKQKSIVKQIVYTTQHRILDTDQHGPNEKPGLVSKIQYHYLHHNYNVWNIFLT